MALATYKPTAAPMEAPMDTSVVAEPRKHEIYDHKETPLWSLDAFLSGSPWEVTYFRQRLGKNDTPKKLDLNSGPAYQSYEKIEKLEILVDTPLSPSFRDKEQIMEVTGSATIYSFLTPNVDDYFITTSNLARFGLVRVTNVNRRTFERESVHVIEYTVEKEITPDDPEYMDIHRKVVSTHVFSKQRLIENRNPLLLKQNYVKVKSLKALYLEMVQSYFRDFFQMASCTLLVPGQLARHYDPLVTGYVTQIVSSLDAPELQRMHLLSTNNQSSYERENLWSLMLKRGSESLPYLTKRMGKIRPNQLKTAYFARSGNFGNADFLITPMVYDQTAVSHTDIAVKDLEPVIVGPLDYQRTTTINGLTIDPSLELYPAGLNEIPYYSSIHSLETYVFPETFYAGERNSVMEVLTMDYIERQPMNLDMLLLMANHYPKMERLEQFYFGPILMTLLKEADRGAYV